MKLTIMTNIFETMMQDAFNKHQDAEVLGFIFKIQKSKIFREKINKINRRKVRVADDNEWIFPKSFNVSHV